MLAEPGIRDHPLEYASRLQTRALDSIDLLVMHCTELPDLATAREFGERVQHADQQTGFSGHFYVDRDGSVHAYVPIDRIAHHTRGCNARSVGIELVNLGRFPDWFDSRRQEMTEPYPSPQIASLLALVGTLRAKLPALRWIAGHEDLDRGCVAASDAPGLQVFRKRDPGPRFPWQEVLGQSGLERMHNV